MNEDINSMGAVPNHNVSKDIKRWHDRIKEVIKYDENARRQYAIDRTYARGDSSNEVAANTLSTYLDITTSFLAAREPEVSVTPSRTIEPPSMEALKDIAEDLVRARPDMKAATDAALSATTMMQDPNAPETAQTVIDILVEQEIEKQYQDMRKTYSRRQRDNRVLAETLEIVIGQLWHGAKIKKRINTSTRSALTISVGWNKASWQTMTGMDDPITTTQLNTIEENIAKVKSMQMDLASKDSLYSMEESDEGLKLADLERQMKAVKEQAEQATSQGFVCDATRAEDIIVAKGVAIADYLDARWIAHKIPMLIEDAKALFPMLEGKWDKATKYYPRKPVMIQNDDIIKSQITEKEADMFITSKIDADTKDSKECWVMPYEIWDKNSNSVLTFVDGILDSWAKEAMSPKPTTRFYPFFLTTMGIIDNERHSQSLTSRTVKLVDEYNRIGSAETEHRRRIRPKTLFNKNAMSAEQATKIMQASTAEYVGVELTDPNADMRTVFVPHVYPQMDASLYDRAPIIAELERIWGVQEALGGAVSVAKTATEADIQQKGFNSRTDDKRDAIEDMLSELAEYTAELAMTNLTVAEVQEMAGADALWVTITKPEQLKSIMRVNIKAGSTGRPNTTLERQNWSILLPQLTEGIQMIGQLRNSKPDDIADKLENLMSMTAKRNGENLDMDSIVPQTTQELMPLMGAPPVDPNAPPPEGMPI